MHQSTTHTLPTLHHGLLDRWLRTQLLLLPEPLSTRWPQRRLQPTAPLRGSLLLRQAAERGADDPGCPGAHPAPAQLLPVAGSIRLPVPARTGRPHVHDGVGRRAGRTGREQCTILRLRPRSVSQHAPVSHLRPEHRAAQVLRAGSVHGDRSDNAFHRRLVEGEQEGEACLHSGVSTITS
ncbi:AGAP005497-PA [Anopheles gambiae str. PEST]|uniref:AGAP005497-PA n=1 Tax=Anopheles gambiae TaxID=7165 RepID=Q7Q756_ANOGA|nr:AGAP005497-PA [Anopheles gambiae str. PEST]